MTKRPTAPTFHRDGTVTFWGVFSQRWLRRVPADRIPAASLSTMSDRDRERIARLRGRAIGE